MGKRKGPTRRVFNSVNKGLTRCLVLYILEYFVGCC